MKLNWGTKIAAIYISFVVFILIMVYLSFGQKYDLVTENYYAEEINYQNTINNRARAEKLDKPLLFKIENAHLKIVFPQIGVQINGVINCFRPSDEDQDFEIKLNTENSFQKIPLNRFIKGKYLIKINWEVDAINYYKEQTVIIP